MTIDKRMVWLAGLLAAALLASTGCGGVECAQGTTENDGECVVAANGCGEGTQLVDGACVPASESCEEGTQFDEEAGRCVPAEGSCSDGTTYDMGTGRCVADTDVVCGDGTAPNDTNICVPSDEACGPMTSLDDQGRCIVQGEVCGAGSELDPNENTCVLVDEACGAGLALDTDAMECVPTSDVCQQPGTTFDDETGLCLPDACDEGDVLVNGVCLSPAEELAQNADVVETENNDPALGGTAESLTLPAVGEDPVSFTGTIGEPTDIDSNGSVDQDVDVYSFTGTAGQWLNLGVQTTGAPAPGFRIEGPNGYERWSAIGLQANPARQVVLPYDGDYTITVIPQIVLDNMDVGPIGGTDWGYVGTVEQIDAPSNIPALDLSSGTQNITGSMPQLTDNIYDVSGMTAGQLIGLIENVSPEDAQVELLIWTDATTLDSTSELSGSGNFTAPGSTALLVLDWVTARGPALDYDYDVRAIGAQDTQTVPADGTISITFPVQKYDALRVVQTNPSDESLVLTVTDPNGNVFGSDTFYSSGEIFNEPVFTPGDYVVEVENDSGADLDITLDVRALPPSIFGQPPADGDTERFQVGNLVEDDKFYVLTDVETLRILQFVHDNDQGDDVTYELYDSTGQEIDDDTSFYPLSYTGFSGPEPQYWYNAADDTLLASFQAEEDLTNFYVEADYFSPNDMGTITPGSSFSVTGGSCIENGAGWAQFNHSTDVEVAFTLSPNAGEDVDFYLYDTSYTELIEETGSGGDVTVPTSTYFGSGTYVIRVECDDAATGWTVTADVTAPSITTLPTLNADSQIETSPATFADDELASYRFDAPANQIIEISHENAEGEEVDLRVLDSNGSLIDDESFFDVRSDSFADYYYFLAESSATYYVQTTATAALTNATLRIRALTPNQLGSIGASGTITDSFARPIADGQIDWHQLTVSSATRLFGSITATGSSGTDVDLEIRDPQFNELTSFSSSGALTWGPVSVTTAPVDVYVGVNSDDGIDSYDVSLNSVATLTPEVEPNGTQAEATSLGSLPAGGSGETEWPGSAGVADYFSVTLASDLGANETLKVAMNQIDDPNTSNGTSSSLELYLYDDAGTELDGDTGADFVESAPGLAAGTYYIGVWQDFDTSFDRGYEFVTWAD